MVQGGVPTAPILQYIVPVNLLRSLPWQNLRVSRFGRRSTGMLKAELKRRNISYAQLVDKLVEIGVSESEPNVRNKLSRGKFTAVFLVQCLEAIGARSLQIAD